MKDHLCITTLFAGALAVTACGNDNGGDVPDGGGMDAGAADSGPDASCEIEPTFTSLHTKIFGAPTCNGLGCHNNAAENGTAGNLKMHDKAIAYTELRDENVFASMAGLTRRVEMGNSTNSFLYRKVNDNTPPGVGSPMPLGCNHTDDRFKAFCLPQCQIDAIKMWIDMGAMDD